VDTSSGFRDIWLKLPAEKSTGCKALPLNLPVHVAHFVLEHPPPLVVDEPRGAPQRRHARVRVVPLPEPARVCLRRHMMLYNARTEIAKFLLLFRMRQPPFAKPDRRSQFGQPSFARHPKLTQETTVYDGHSGRNRRSQFGRASLADLPPDRANYFSSTELIILARRILKSKRKNELDDVACEDLGRIQHLAGLTDRSTRRYSEREVSMRYGSRRSLVHRSSMRVPR